MNNGTHIKNGVIYSGGANEADQIAYDNTASGLEATNTQEAIDEINSDLTALLEVDTLQTDTWGQVATKIYLATSNINMTRPPQLELIFHDGTSRIFEASTYTLHGLHARSTEAINDGTQNVVRMFDIIIASSPAFRTALFYSSSTSVTDNTNATATVVKAKVYY